MTDVFLEEVRENGHDVVKINVAEKQIGGCLACQACFANGGICVQKDDMTEIMTRLDETDLLVLASPIYWNGFSAQLKLVIDRFYASVKKGFHVKESILLLDAADDDVFSGVIEQYKEMIAYLQWEDRGIITVPGMENKGDMAHAPELEDVRRLAASI